MLDVIRELSHWFIGFADSDFAVWILAISSFAESIFFPIPPDPLLIALSINQPQNALIFAVIVTIASVAGAVVGHWLGARFGRPLLLRFVSESKVDAVERMFLRYGTWAILFAAFTPIPYKVFAITAGILEMNRRSFIIASIIGRGARFLLIGALVFVYGEEIQGFIESQFEILTILASVGLLAGAVLFAVVARHRRRRNAPG